MTKFIGVVGSRRRDKNPDFLAVRKVVMDNYEEGDIIISGGCPQGADRFAERVAKAEGFPIFIIHPDWKRYGKGAGFVRNGTIAEIAEILIACVSANRKGGTEDTIKKFEKFHPSKKAILT